MTFFRTTRSERAAFQKTLCLAVGVVVVVVACCCVVSIDSIGITSTTTTTTTTARTNRGSTGVFVNAWFVPSRGARSFSLTSWTSSPLLLSTVLTRESTKQMDQVHHNPSNSDGAGGANADAHANAHGSEDTNMSHGLNHNNQIHDNNNNNNNNNNHNNIAPPPQAPSILQQAPNFPTIWEELHHRFVMTEIPGVSNKCHVYEAQLRNYAENKPEEGVGRWAIIKISKLHGLMRLEADIYKHVNNSKLFVKVYEYHAPRTEEDVSVLIMERGHIDVRNFMKLYGPFSGTALLEMAKTAADIVHHLHSKGRVWTELKSQNFVMTDDGSIKAIDFESAIPVDHRNILYTAPYAPPEFALEDLCGRNMPMDFSFDIWSYGMFLYEIATGSLYFKDKNFEESDRIRIFSYLKNAEELDLSRLQDMEDVSQDYKDLVSQCLKVDATKRPTIQQVLNHSFFKNYEALC